MTVEAPETSTAAASRSQSQQVLGQSLRQEPAAIRLGDAMPAKIDHRLRKANLRSHIAAGKSNHEIAAVMRLSLRTIEHYINQYGFSRMRRRLGIRSVRTGQIVGPVTVRKCLGCGAKVPAHGGRWLCDRCRTRRGSESRGVPDHWLETPGHA